MWEPTNVLVTYRLDFVWMAVGLRWQLDHVARHYPNQWEMTPGRIHRQPLPIHVLLCCELSVDLFRWTLFLSSIVFLCTVVSLSVFFLLLAFSNNFPLQYIHWVLPIVKYFSLSINGKRIRFFLCFDWLALY